MARPIELVKLCPSPPKKVLFGDGLERDSTNFIVPALNYWTNDYALPDVEILAISRRSALLCGSTAILTT